MVKSESKLFRLKDMPYVVYVANDLRAGYVLQGQAIDLEYLIAHFQIIAIGRWAV